MQIARTEISKSVVSILDNRELASVILLGSGVLWALRQERVRKSLVGLARVFVKPPILGILLAMLAWVGLEVLMGARIDLWSSDHAKATVLWSICSAGVLVFNCAQTQCEATFFRRTLGGAFGAAVFITFLVNLYPMSLIIEIILQSVVVTLVVRVRICDLKPGHKRMKPLFESLLGVIGLALIAHAALQIYLSWSQLDLQQLLLKFLLPVWLTFGLGAVSIHVQSTARL